MENSKKPYNFHLWWENNTYGIYFVDSTNQDVLLKTTDEGVNVSTITTRTRKIQSGWHDKTNNKIYFVSCNQADTQFTCWYIDLTDDSITEMGTYAGTDVYAFDIFYMKSNFQGAYFWFVIGREDIATANNIIICTWNDPNWNRQKNRLGEDIAFVSVYDPEGAGDGGTYCLIEETGDNVILKYYVELAMIGPSWFNIDDPGANNQIPANRSLAGIAKMLFQGTLYYWFILYDTVNTKNYLWTTEGTIVTKDEEMNVMIMLDRNSLGTVNSPWEYEFAGHTTYSYVFRVARKFPYFIKLQDIALTGGETIIAISDKYLITSNSDLYKYTESLSDLSLAKATYKTHGFPKGKFDNITSLSTNQLIEIWEFDDPTYTLAFRSKLGTPKYNIRKGKPFYQFSPKNFGFDDLNQKVSYTATAEDVGSVVRALLGQLTNPYIYCDATSVPNIAVNMTYTFDDVRLKDALYVCSILGNVYWWYEPNGYLYFRTWAGKPDSGDTFSQDSNDMGPQKAVITQIQYNSYNNVRGGWDAANNTEFTPTTPTIVAHVQQYGPLEWNGRKSFAGAESQASLDAIVAGLKAWQGMIDNPVDAEGFVIGKYYYKIGYYASHQYSGRFEFATPTDRLIIKNETDFKRPGKIKLTFSNNLVRKS